MKKTEITHKEELRCMVQTAIFAAIIILLSCIPMIGYIPLGFTRATIIHVPVILGCLALGPKRGAALGFVFAMTSFVNNTLNPTVTSFVFTPFYSAGPYSGGWGSLIICFVPRILTGVVPWYVGLFSRKLMVKMTGTRGSDKDPARHRSLFTAVSLTAAGVIGSMTNTLLVMNLIYLIFRDSFADAHHIAGGAVYGFILSLIGINGVPEAVLSGMLTWMIGRVILRGSVKEK